MASADLAEVITRVRGAIDSMRKGGHFELKYADVLVLAAEAERLQLANSELHREALEAHAEAERLRGELEAAQREIARRKAMQPVDRDGSPITQAPANRLMIAYYDDLPAAQRETERLRGELEAAQRHIVIVRESRDTLHDLRDEAVRESERLRGELEAAQGNLDEARTAQDLISLDLDQARVQLAGCLIAAEGGNTANVKRGDYAWTLALETTRELARENAALRAALRPFEVKAAAIDHTPDMSGKTQDDNDMVKVRLGYLRAARTVLNQPTKGTAT